MKHILRAFILFLLITVYPTQVFAAWIWSPDIGKWINPKKAAKDTPEEQFDWAMEFYSQKNWDRAIEEFEKVAGAFPNSKLAAEGTYYAGLSWEEKHDSAKAVDAYQRLIDRYPYSDRIKDAVAREFQIAKDLGSGEKIRVWGVPLLNGQEKAIEIFKHIVKNAPGGSYGDQAQFQIGEVYKAQGEYEEAQKAYQAVVDEYPSSALVAQARYQIAYVAMQASRKSQYNEQYADRAIDQFKEFKEQYPDQQQALEADESIRALRTHNAERQFETAMFYEKQKKYASAKVYYMEIVDRYPDTPLGEKARAKAEEMLKRESGEAAPAKKFKILPW